MNEADNSPEMTVVMDHEAIDAALRRIAQEIVADSEALSDVALLGILSRGRPLAERLAACIEGLTGTRPRVGSLATTLYRDDLRSGRLVALLEDYAVPPLGIYAVFPQRRHLPLRVRLFIDLLKTTYGASSYWGE